MNLLLLTALIILAYWVVGVAWVLSQRDWD